MATIFSDALLDHFATKFSLSIEDVTEALREFVLGETPKPKAPPQKLSPRETKQTSITDFTTKEAKSPEEIKRPKKVGKEEIHYCERMLKGKGYTCGSEEATKERGKKARRTAKRFIEMDGKKVWVCGTEKSGCYKSFKNEACKAEARPKTIPEKKQLTQAEIKAKVLGKHVKTGTTYVKTIVAGEQIWYDPETGYVVNKELGKVYSKVRETPDGRVLVDLTEGDKKILDARDIPFVDKKDDEDDISEDAEAEEGDVEAEISDDAEDDDDPEDE